MKRDHAKTLREIYEYVKNLQTWDRPLGTDTRCVVWMEGDRLRYSWTRKGCGDPQ